MMLYNFAVRLSCWRKKEEEEESDKKDWRKLSTFVHRSSCLVWINCFENHNYPYPIFDALSPFLLPLAFFISC